MVKRSISVDIYKFAYRYTGKSKRSKRKSFKSYELNKKKYTLAKTDLVNNSWTAVK